MAITNIIDLKLRALLGGDGASDIDLYAVDSNVRLTQQSTEIINSGDPAAQKVRLTQQALEAINSGDPAAQDVRLTQQYVEVICTFGTPPVTGSGKGKGGAPGQIKKGQQESYIIFRERLRRAKRHTTMRFTDEAQIYTVDPYMLSLMSPDPIKIMNETRVIRRD